MMGRAGGTADAGRGISRAAGPARFRLLVRIGLAAILVCVLLERFLYYQELAERAEMEATIMHIRSGMRWHVVDLMTQQRSDEIAFMLEEDPVRWLRQPPGGYLGAFDVPPAEVITGGSWYFDRSVHELVYVPRLKRFLSGGYEGKEIRFQVRAKITLKEGGDKGVRVIEDLNISARKSYRWF